MRHYFKKPGAKIPQIYASFLSFCKSCCKNDFIVAILGQGNHFFVGKCQQQISNVNNFCNIGGFQVTNLINFEKKMAKFNGIEVISDQIVDIFEIYAKINIKSTSSSIPNLYSTVLVSCISATYQNLPTETYKGHIRGIKEVKIEMYPKLSPDTRGSKILMYPNLPPEANRGQ